MSSLNSRAVLRAITVLKGGPRDVDELYRLAMQLQEENEFDYARRLLAMARRPGNGAPKPGVKVTHLGPIRQKAICTCKDPDIPAHSRFERALEIIREVDQLGGGEGVRTVTDDPTSWISPS